MIERADSSLTCNSSRGLATKPARIRCSHCNFVQNSWSTFPVNDCRHNRSCCNATTPTLLFSAHLYTCRFQGRSFCMASSAAPLTTDMTAPITSSKKRAISYQTFSHVLKTSWKVSSTTHPEWWEEHKVDNWSVSDSPKWFSMSKQKYVIYANHRSNRAQKALIETDRWRWILARQKDTIGCNRNNQPTISSAKILMCKWMSHIGDGLNLLMGTKNTINTTTTRCPPQGDKMFNYIANLCSPDFRLIEGKKRASSLWVRRVTVVAKLLH